MLMSLTSTSVVQAQAPSPSLGFHGRSPLLSSRKPQHASSRMAVDMTGPWSVPGASSSGRSTIGTAFLGMGIGAVTGLVFAVILNEVDPPAEQERLIGIPILFGVFGFFGGLAVGRT